MSTPRRQQPTESPFWVNTSTSTREAEKEEISQNEKVRLASVSTDNPNKTRKKIKPKTIGYWFLLALLVAVSIVLAVLALLELYTLPASEMMGRSVQIRDANLVANLAKNSEEEENEQENNDNNSNVDQDQIFIYPMQKISSKRLAEHLGAEVNLSGPKSKNDRNNDNPIYLVQLYNQTKRQWLSLNLKRFQTETENENCCYAFEWTDLYCNATPFVFQPVWGSLIRNWVRIWVLCVKKSDLGRKQIQVLRVLVDSEKEEDQTRDSVSQLCKQELTEKWYCCTQSVLNDSALNSRHFVARGNWAKEEENLFQLQLVQH